MRPFRIAVCSLVVTTGIPFYLAAEQSIELSKLDLSLMTAGWGQAQADKAVTGKPLRIGTRDFTTGVGTHADSELYVALGGHARRFQAQVGVDAAAGDQKASIEFIVYGDGKELWKSGVCKLGEAPRTCDVALDGVQTLILMVTDAGDGVSFDHADWAEARIVYDGVAPKAVRPPQDPPVILTPLPPDTPQVNGPKVYGARPGSPFLYRIPATGRRPMTFMAEDLPGELNLDAASGIITGKVPAAGTYKVTLIARNEKGEAKREFRIMAGDKLALTPPMGWNHWYTHYGKVTDAIIRAAADAMISSGMADYGYQYVNVDDCWMVKPGAKEEELGGEPRDAGGRIRPNKRFPDMKALADYIHSKGLKAGLYTSPGPKTCGGFAGSYQHEALDAKTFAEWGYDFLKYDWCSYGGVAGGKDREDLIKPYKLMWDELQKQDRDIVFNLCQYGMGKVWEWGGSVGNCWRTTGDLGVEGGSLSKGIYKVGLFNATLAEYAGPGHWNDPDYLLFGWSNDAHSGGGKRAAPLSPAESHSQMAMWALCAAPLIYSGDMSRLDPLTLSILCNHEVIDVDQDPLGKQARIVQKTSDVLILAKDMEDSSKAVGLFNLGVAPREIVAEWPALGLTGPQRVRDLWRQKDLGESAGPFKTTVPRHGVMLVRLWPL